MTSRFEDALTRCIQAIPPGKVATCGTIARALGDVRAARAVAAWIRERPELDPKDQVVRSDGRSLLPRSMDTPKDGLEPESMHEVDASRFVDHLEPVPLLADLRAEQLRLASRVSETDEPGKVEILGGVDVGYADRRAVAVAVLLDAGSLDVLEIAKREVEVDFPYIPSYLAFREYPAVQAAVTALKRKPDVLFVDGHGRLHPALFGFACFAGVSLDIPTIGIAKHLLTGDLLPVQRSESGAIPIGIQGSVRGYAWRPPRAARAFYVSVGHRISLGRALDLAQASMRDRYPEPLRLADHATKEGKRKKTGKDLRQGRG